MTADDILGRAEKLLSGDYRGLIHAEDMRQLLTRARELSVSLVEMRAQYLLWLDENPDCKAWDFDELADEEQDRYRRDAVEELKIEEPWMSIQLREARKEAALWREIATEERAVANFGGEGEGQDYHIDFEHLPDEGEDEVVGGGRFPTSKRGYRDQARRELGISESVDLLPTDFIHQCRECEKYCHSGEECSREWVELTPERRAALEYAAESLARGIGLPEEIYIDQAIARVLRAMLEAGK